MATATLSGPPKVRQTRLLINGEWCNAASGKTFTNIAPATEEAICQVAEGGPEDIDRAVKAARRAFDKGSWAKMSARERGTLMFKLADLIEKNSAELAALETLDNGKPIAEATGADLPLVIECFRYYAGWADKLGGETIPVGNMFGEMVCMTLREPIGVCGQIIPWNFPLLMAAWKLGPALAAGNTLVLKPAEQTPLSALRLGELCLEAGFPPGVINIVPGFGETAGAALVKHPEVDKIAFTGEYKTAQLIMANAAPTLKRLTFELGGKSPNVVFADADLKSAVGGAFGGIFFNQGEVCCAGSRLFVEKKIHDEFLSELKGAAEKRRVGDPFDPKTHQGAQVSKEQFDKVMHYIKVGREEDRATCITGGDRAASKGYFVKPTIFTGVNQAMKIARDEIFGPVLSVIPFDNEEKLVEQANDTYYGLAAGVFTRDISKAFRFAKSVRAGTIWVNCYNTFDAAAPFGGYKFSGQGRELGKAGIENYTEIKTVWVKI